MILTEGWDCAPEAMHVYVMRCVVCGDYCGPDDMYGWVEWNNEGSERTQSPVLTYHRGNCVNRIDQVVMHSPGDGMLLDMHIEDALRWLSHNVKAPPQVGADGLMRCRRRPLDLLRTHDLLFRLASPLLRDER